jgi:putative lipoprotein
VSPHWSLRAIVLLLTLLFQSAAVARARDDDPWLGHDKVLHFSVSIALGAGGYGASALWVEPRRQRALLGGAFALTVGGAKELYDLSGRGDPSWRDFSWDVLGSAVGVGVGYLIDLTVERVRHSRRETRTALSDQSRQTRCLAPRRCAWRTPSAQSSPPALVRW